MKVELKQEKKSKFFLYSGRKKLSVRSLDPEQTRQIEKYYNAGTPLKDIADLVYGCDLELIKRYIYKVKDRADRNRKWTRADINRIKERYLDGVSIEEQAKEYGVHRCSINSLMKRNGVVLKELKKRRA